MSAVHTCRPLAGETGMAAKTHR